ncbi:hypothetical protein EZV62_017734 [Acer yangbiense]|uniref:Uncharacterized protein n=1 Tax=Acer yangbiense TaxID=1000413 RepID=A0A5C7HHE8_9ROSI|nr:hypothetical protein EZV62_017734 [Acer yangbiense]
MKIRFKVVENRQLKLHHRVRRTNQLAASCWIMITSHPVCRRQSASSRTESANSEPQSACNVLNISVNDRKDNCMVSVHLGSESSMTQAETSKDPGTEA